MENFTTRTQCVDYLVAEGYDKAIAKIAINECFNQIPVAPEEDKDLCREVISETESKITTVPPELCKKAFDEVLLEDISINNVSISIQGEPKYDLMGELLPTELPPAAKEQNAPSTETQQ